MDGMTLLYDPDQEARVREKLLPLFAGHAVTAVAFDAAAIPDLPAEAVLLTWLDDAALAQLIPAVLAKGWRLGLLPHPGLRQARVGFAVPSKLEDAVDALLAAEEPMGCAPRHRRSSCRLRRVLILLPARPKEPEQRAPDAKEVFRVQGLPTGEAVQELVSRPLSWIHHAAAEEFKDREIVLEVSIALVC